MRHCPLCRQPLAEDVRFCPACGARIEGRSNRIDDYTLTRFVSEGYGSLLYQARRDNDPRDYLIRIFKAATRMGLEMVDRLRRELETLRELPAETFVRHFEIRCSSEGEWYRVSDWVDSLPWPDFIASGIFSDPVRRHEALDFLAGIAEALAELHCHGHLIPHLIRPDILPVHLPSGGYGVKLDYKLSRFLDPRLAHPSPILKALMASHPDILAGRPLDRRSDIWSLGRIFAQLLTGEEDLTVWQERQPTLGLPLSLVGLLNGMLEPDPDQRPGDMNEVARQLRRYTLDDLQKALEDRPVGNTAELRPHGGMKRLFVVLILLLLIVAGGGLYLQLRHGLFSHNETRIFARHAEKYAKATALVAVEYWLEQPGGKRLAGNISQGTAFLVDGDGYLVTNRHVACPWLADSNFLTAMAEAERKKESASFKYRLWVWFEGSMAFRRQIGRIDKPTLPDFFYSDTAFRSDGSPGVRIAGIMPMPTERRQLLRSPLGNDVAILKLDQPPAGITPIGLASESARARKLLPIMAIGYPGGQDAIPDNRVVPNTTIGHIRASFRNVLLGNISLHGGNSGGPVFDLDGKAIGIASAVRMDTADLGLFAVPLPQSDFAMILPIEQAASFLAGIKKGEPAWNGVLDPELTAGIRRFMEKAQAGEWDGS